MFFKFIHSMVGEFMRERNLLIIDARSCKKPITEWPEDRHSSSATRRNTEELNIVSVLLLCFFDNRQIILQS